MTAPGILVTGGGGFIGSHLARRFLDLGRTVWVLDNFSTGRRENVPHGARILELDLRDPVFTRALPATGIEAIFHLAAQSSGEISNEDPVGDLETNLLGTVRLLDWASRHCRRFVFASSMAVYGQSTKERVSEDVPAEPLSYYGLGKWAAERYVGRFHRPGFSTQSLRLFSVYGPGQNLRNFKQGMISIYMAYALKGEPVLVKGSFDRFRDFVFVDDAVDAFMKSLDTVAAGRVHNVGTGRKTTVREVLRAVLAVLGKEPDHPVVEADPTPADQFGLVADPSRAAVELGWTARVGLEEGLVRMARWAQDLTR